MRKPGKLNYDVRDCHACGEKITQVRIPSKTSDPFRPWMWVNANGVFDQHICEKKVKVYTPEEIAALNKERGYT